jgi:predicted ATP-binding protein involved in virulence
MTVPTNVERVNLKKLYGLDEKANYDFIKYIVSLKADRSFARDEGNETEVQNIDKWFELFEKQLRVIFDDKNLKLLFERNSKEYNFKIKTAGNEFGLNELSDGYAAILNIVSELLLRMNAHNAKAYDMEGIVLIDEIETHLHVELQKRILPFLTAFFPKIQFIVTTHSPFVLQSVENATICDLETRIITQDLTAYSYDALVESFFMTDKYSEIVKEKIAEYEKLLAKTEKTAEDTENIKSLQNYFAFAPKYLSQELRVKLQQIELKELS